jgi:hypothetical protein
MMRIGLLILVLVTAFGYNLCGRAASDAAVPSLSQSSMPKPTSPNPAVTLPTKVDFATQVRPMLEQRCTPCHFAGGTMYQRLPFDRSETIKSLGTKLFSRIKGENEQYLIRQFLSQ